MALHERMKEELDQRKEFWKEKGIDSMNDMFIFGVEKLIKENE